MMKMRAAGTVPAAVIIIGRARPYSAAAVDHGAIAGEIGLRGQHVHHLRAGDARHQLHGEGGDPGVGHGLQRGLVAVGIHDGEHERAGLHGREFGRVGAADLQHDVGAVRAAFAFGAIVAPAAS